MKVQDSQVFPVTRVKVSEHVILYKTGFTGSYPNMIAVNTTEGVVVIDSHQYPEVAKRIREMINNDFNKEVKYLINSHAAYDHFGGNIAFEDVPIISSKNVYAGVKQFLQMSKSPQFAQFIEQELINKPNSYRSAYTGDPLEIDESIESNKNLLTAIKENTFDIVLPDTVFEDYMVFSVGETSFQLFENTPSYSRSDIVIYIPEEKVLIVGDIFNKDRLPLISRETNLDSWMSLFDKFLNENTDIKYFIGTHGYPISREEIIEQINYVKKLYEEVKSYKAKGSTLDVALHELSLDHFPFLNKYNPCFYGTIINTHERNINSIWMQ